MKDASVSEEEYKVIYITPKHSVKLENESKFGGPKMNHLTFAPILKCSIFKFQWNGIFQFGSVGTVRRRGDGRTVGHRHADRSMGGAFGEGLTC